jgi:hypothetical protein
VRKIEGGRSAEGHERASVGPATPVDARAELEKALTEQAASASAMSFGVQVW